VAAGGGKGLKVQKTRSGESIILIPQPSDDPNDPLNWPLWRRDLICFILSMSAIFATSLGSILAADTIVLTMRFKRLFTEVALMTGYFLMGVGAAAVFFVPSGRVWGKRHAFIVGLMILVASSAWAGAVRTNYGSFIAARAIQGVGCAPFETLVNAAVGDLYFVHQRGIRMAFTNLAVFGGAFLTPVFVGKITNVLGWWWNFNLVAIFCGLCLPAVFFFCPETAYRRDAKLNTDMVADGDATDPQSASSTEARASESVEKPLSSTDAASNVENAERGMPAAAAAVIPPMKTWKQRLALFDGRKTDESFWKLLLRPFPLLFQPAFAWACLIQGTMIGWTVFIGVILASIFIGPPYWWNEVKTGYTYVGPFVGALIGFALSGILADTSAKFMTRRNNGIYEPEFRIVLIVPMSIIGCAGLYGFGATASQITGGMHWVVPVVFFAMQVAGMVLGTVSSSLYIVDAYREFLSLLPHPRRFKRIDT
jgi:MFS family permease